MIYEYNIEILGKNISGTIDIPLNDTENMNEFEISDYIYNYLNEQIKNTMQIFIYEKDF